MHLFSGFLAVDGNLFAHGSEDDDVDILALIVEEFLDLVTALGTVWDLDIVLGGSIVRHKGEETVIGDIEKLVFLATDVGDIHVVGGWAQFFKLLASEDVNGDEMDFGVTVLASLGGGHVNDLARAVLDHDEAVLPERRALHGEGGGGTSIGALEGVLLMLGVVGHVARCLGGL
jgi:hypothetical protein